MDLRHSYEFHQSGKKLDIILGTAYSIKNPNRGLRIYFSEKTHWNF